MCYCSIKIDCFLFNYLGAAALESKIRKNTVIKFTLQFKNLPNAEVRIRVDFILPLEGLFWQE